MYRFIFLIFELMWFALRFGLYTRTTPNGMVAYQRIFEFGETLIHIRTLLRNAQSPLLVLDIGGDRTIFPFFLALKFPLSVDIVDLGDMDFAKQLLNKMPKEAASRIRIYPNQDATKMARKTQYDIITIISVIEHIPEDGDRLIMNQIHGLLKNGGALVITAPFTAKQETVMYSNAKNYYKDQQVRDTNFYMRLYSEEGIRQLVTNAENMKKETLLFAGEAGFLFSEKIMWRRSFLSSFGNRIDLLTRYIILSMLYPISPIFALFFIKISPTASIFLKSENTINDYMHTPNAFMLVLRKELQ